MGNDDLDLLHTGDYRRMTTDVATGLSRATARLTASHCPADGLPRFGCNLSRINWQTSVADQSSDHSDREHLAEIRCSDH
jgi:hypothetical protein